MNIQPGSRLKLWANLGANTSRNRQMCSDFYLWSRIARKVLLYTLIHVIPVMHGRSTSNVHSKDILR